MKILVVTAKPKNMSFEKCQYLRQPAHRRSPIRISVIRYVQLLWSTDHFPLFTLLLLLHVFKGDIAVRGGFSLIGSCVENWISEFIIITFYYYPGSPMSES